MSAPTESWAYIGRLKVANKRLAAGTVAAAIVDDPARAKDVSKQVAQWMREGCTIERVPVEWVRQHLFSTTPYAPVAEVRS